MDKKSQRQRLLQARLHMPDRAARHEALQDVLRSWLLSRQETVIGAWWPIKGEFDPLPALHRWKEDGELNDAPQRRRIGLPVTERATKTMHYQLWYPGCEMGPDPSGIPMPIGTEVIQPSLILAPCVGYAVGGYRLGFGGGYFDRTLALLDPKPVTVGVCYAQGFVEDFVAQEHDVPLDIILTENGLAWPVPFTA